jgi:hypothetical protein
MISKQCNVSAETGGDWRGIPSAVHGPPRQQAWPNWAAFGHNAARIHQSRAAWQTGEATGFGFQLHKT